MPAKKPTSRPKTEQEFEDEVYAAASGQIQAADPPDEDKHDTPVETVMVVKTTEEPVRAGGYILTEDGWVPEER